MSKQAENPPLRPDQRAQLRKLQKQLSEEQKARNLQPPRGAVGLDEAQRARLDEKYMQIAAEAKKRQEDDLLSRLQRMTPEQKAKLLSVAKQLDAENSPTPQPAKPERKLVLNVKGRTKTG